jgi:ligand-binding sensor domain-containing protein/signal transduction histidine kinase
MLLCLIWLEGQVYSQIYPFKRYTVDEGLPQSVAYTVFQDSKGYIWSGTQGGLSRFDGMEFNTFTTADGLADDRVLCITEDAYGRLWIGTNDGVSIYDGTQLTVLPYAIGTVYSIVPDAAGNIFIGSGRGLGMLRTDTPDTVSMISNIPAPVYSLYEISTGVLLVGTAHGLFRVNYISPESFEITSLQVFAPVMCITTDSEGKIWAGTDGEGLAVLANGTVRWLRAEDGLGINKVYSILIDTSGIVWVATYGRGVLNIARERITRHTTLNGLPSNVVRSIIQDREGNLWFATYGGLARLRYNGLTYYDTSLGLTNSIVMAILRDKTGTLWIGTYGGGINKLHDGKVTHFKAEHGLSHDVVRSILEDSRGTVWIGTHGGTTRIDGESIRRYTTRDGLPGDIILSIYEDRIGRIWIGTFGGGVGYFSDGKFTVFTTADGLAHNTVRTIIEDTDGTIWIGTDNGLSRYENGIFRNFYISDGLSHNTIRALSGGPDGSLWIATDGGGISILRNNAFTSLTVADGLANNVCFLVLRDNDNRMWVGTNKGLNRVTFDYENEKIQEIITILMRDGLPSNEFNTGAGYLDNEGALWFGTVGGLVRVEGGFDAGYAIPPRVLITKVKVFETTQNIESTLVLPYNENYLKFEYAGLHYSSPEDVEYKYKLVGLDNEWHFSNVRSVQYASLPSGQYTFEITARGRGSDWNPEPVQMHIYIVPPYWSTWWFRAIILILFGAMLGYIYNRRIRGLKKAQSESEEFSKRLIKSQEQERKRIAGELHDSLGQNLLIIKNRALMGLQPSGEHNQTDQLEYISGIVSQAIHEVREIAYNLQPYQLERLGLKEALDSVIAKVADVSGIQFHTSIDELNGKFTKDVELNIYRIVQESLNNIVKHADAHEVRITASRDDGMIVLNISDNGKGFTVRRSGSALGNDDHGFGLKSIAERVRIINGQLEISSHPGTGTTLTVKVPSQMI